MTDAMKNDDANKLRVFFIPFFASGHMIPMADLAALFSVHPSVSATICLTPANADLLRPTLHPSVSILLYPFPSEAACLPPGIENLSTASPEQEHKVYRAVDLSEPAHRELLLRHRPDAIVADIPFSWTTYIAQEIGIPRITWHAVGVFPQAVMNCLHKQIDDIIHRSNDDIIAIKGLPGKIIKMRVSELPEFVKSRNFFAEVFQKLKTAQLESYGAVVNTFYEMEPEYCDFYRATDCKRGWFVGPVALARGVYNSVATGERDQCLRWLDDKEEGSVIFVCFGSWCYFKDEQLKEMAAGLERSGRRFLWVVRKSDGDWMPDKEWVMRVEGRGKVVSGWAPQVAILGHKAVGGFLTHCGWNSVLEAMAAGVPMLTWPLVFEQFINERLVVDVLGTGGRASEGFRSTREEEKVTVTADTIAQAVSRFMEKEGEDRLKRTKAMNCAEMARAAVAEGGSSSKDLKSLIDELKELRDKRLKESQEIVE